MRVKTISILLCWILILTSPGVMAQQSATPNQSWDVLRQTLTAGKVMIEKKTAKKVTGELNSVSDTELVIERKNKLETFKRDEVKNVWTVALPSRTKQKIFGGLGFAGGLLGGAMIAVALGFKQCGDSCTDEGIGIVAALVGLPIAGLFLGASTVKGKRTLVYTAP